MLESELNAALQAQIQIYNILGVASYSDHGVIGARCILGLPLPYFSHRGFDFLDTERLDIFRSVSAPDNDRVSVDLLPDKKSPVDYYGSQGK